MENEKTPERKSGVRIPPQRGQVKVMMFNQIVKTVKSVVTLGKKGGSGNGSSASTTPPSSNYPSEGHSDA
ncbi:hypothetical protein CCACVL1_18148 [Corchorus capsularis]|uniref:Uncharacterized protein n=1 Tax=Corchorus capsularis TaxID=210143 RepID=A0A1R3HMQ4_COCAP|nr:hypothetical protein CCACVL1_18148 [Corchorus capsularis]